MRIQCLVPFKWHILLSQIIPKIVYDEGTAVSGISGDNIQPGYTIKEWQYFIYAYTYANGLIGPSRFTYHAHLDACDCVCMPFSKHTATHAFSACRQGGRPERQRSARFAAPFKRRWMPPAHRSDQHADPRVALTTAALRDLVVLALRRQKHLPSSIQTHYSPGHAKSKARR